MPCLQYPCDMNKCELIRAYILAKKGVDIGGIAEPRNAHEWELFNRAWQVAMIWHATK